MIFRPPKLNLRKIQGFPSSDIKMHINLQTHEPTHKHLCTQAQKHARIWINIHTRTHTHKYANAYFVRSENMKGCLCIHSGGADSAADGLCVWHEYRYSALSGPPHLLCNAKQPQSGIAAARQSEGWLLAHDVSVVLRARTCLPCRNTPLPPALKNSHSIMGNSRKDFCLSRVSVHIIIHPGVCLSATL